MSDGPDVQQPKLKEVFGCNSDIVDQQAFRHSLCTALRMHFWTQPLIQAWPCREKAHAMERIAHLSDLQHAGQQRQEESTAVMSSNQIGA